MKFPWDKLEFKKVEPGKKQDGIKINPRLMDEIGQMKSPFPNDIGWKNIPLITDPQLQYEVKSYPDGAKYVVIKDMHNKLTFRLNSYEDLWILNQIHDVVKSAGWSVTVTIPFLIDSQADRRFGNDQPHGLKLVCNFLNGLTNFNYKAFHPHNAEVVEALLDRVEIVDNFEFIRKVLLEIPTFKEDMEGKINTLILMSSDSGGFKPLMKLTDKLKWQGETFSASKSRKYEDGHSKLVQQVDRQDFGGKDILLIDDLMVGGSTFLGLTKLLKQRNCGKLYLAVSHITIENPNNNLWGEFDKIFCTNSKGLTYKDVEGNFPQNLEVIDLF